MLLFFHFQVSDDVLTLALTQNQVRILYILIYFYFIHFIFATLTSKNIFLGFIFSKLLFIYY